MKPSIGRIVHFVDAEGEHCAAIITRVWSDDCVNLIYFHDTGSMPYTSSVQDETATKQCSWHWPEKV